MTAKARRQFYTDSVDANKDDPKKLWKTLNNILHRKPESVLPDCKTDKSLAERFSEFFVDKISKIRLTFPEISYSPVIYDHFYDHFYTFK